MAIDWFMLFIHYFPFPLFWTCFGCLFDMLDSPDAIMHVIAIVDPIIKS